MVLLQKVTHKQRPRFQSVERKRYIYVIFVESYYFGISLHDACDVIIVQDIFFVGFNNACFGSRYVLQKKKKSSKSKYPLIVFRVIFHTSRFLF